MQTRRPLTESERRQRIAALMHKHRPLIVPAPISEPTEKSQRPSYDVTFEVAATEQVEPPVDEPAPAPPSPPAEVVRLPDHGQPKETTMPFVAEKPTVVIVGADKGGVGKTTLSRVMLDYFSAQGLPVRAFDTESPKGSLKRFFQDVTEIVDLRNSDDQAKVFDTIDTSSITLIDIRAGLLTDTLTLLKDVGYQDLVNEGKINSAVMHVIGSTMDSFGEIDQVAKLLAGSKHCIVLNRHNGADFFKGVDEVARQALTLGSSIIDIPQLDPRTMEHVDAAGVPFGQFEKDPKFGFMARGKVRKWEGDVFAQLDAAQLNIQ